MEDGERVIELRPQRPPGQRWEGHVTSDPPEQQRFWAGGSCEQVEDMMDADLGAPAQPYRVLEGGA